MRNCRLNVTVLLAAATISAWAPSTTAATQQPVGDLFERYSTNGVEALSDATVSSEAFSKVVDRIEQGGEAWVRQDPADEPRRRLLAATFALDAAASVLGTTKQVPARRLFVWARDAMRSMPVDDSVRTWHLASVALIQRAGYWDLFPAHWADAVKALPGEPRLALAAAVAEEAGTWTSAPPADSMVSAFEVLAADPRIKAEALVRLGVTYLRKGDIVRARQVLSDARAATDDGRLIYLSHVAAALCADRANDRDAMATHASAALKAKPGAQTASSLFAVAAIRQDRHEAASDALELFYSGAVEDPWLSYRHGDGYRWPEYLTRLREAVRR